LRRADRAAAAPPAARGGPGGGGVLPGGDHVGVGEGRRPRPGGDRARRGRAAPRDGGSALTPLPATASRRLRSISSSVKPTLRDEVPCGSERVSGNPPAPPAPHGCAARPRPRDHRLPPRPPPPPLPAP